MTSPANEQITIAGAGVLGLWQALTLARAGHRVRLIDQSNRPFTHAASRYAGAMLSPGCEGEAAPPVVVELGRQGLDLWRQRTDGVVSNGTLVVAAARDLSDLTRFAKMTEGGRAIDASSIASLEPELKDRFASGLYFEDEAHVATADALTGLLTKAYEAGVECSWGQSLSASTPEGWIVDCRGLGARNDLPDLRGVRGERILVYAPDVSLTRPVRLLHPRHPLYVVPWANKRYLIGATMIESEDESPVTVRSALELLGAAYSLHPAFAEAQILDMGSGVRPSFPDNVPRAILRPGEKRIFVNGAYRHGFLLAPVLADAVAGLFAGKSDHPLLRHE